MKAYVSTSGNVSGVFPVTVAVNSSTGTSTNGTPYVADYVSDAWSMLQGLMDRVAMTPSGTIEAYTAVAGGNASGQGAITGAVGMQHIQSLQYQFGAPGELVFDFFGPDTLAGTRRVLSLTGQVVDGFLYPDLAYNCWVGAGANGTAPFFFTTSDAGGTTRVTTGLTVNGVTMGRYMVMPDLRGLSPIGLGTNVKTAIAYAGGSALGAYLADQFQGHIHNINANGSGTNGFQATGTNSGTVNTTGPINDGTNGTPRTGVWTRTPGFACTIGIRY